MPGPQMTRAIRSLTTGGPLPLTLAAQPLASSSTTNREGAGDTQELADLPVRFSADLGLLGGGGPHRLEVGPGLGKRRGELAAVAELPAQPGSRGEQAGAPVRRVCDRCWLRAHTDHSLGLGGSGRAEHGITPPLVGKS